MPKRNKQSRRVNKGDFVRAPDGFEGWVAWIGDPGDPRGGQAGFIMVEVRGPMGTKRYPPKELRKVPRTDEVPA